MLGRIMDQKLLPHGPSRCDLVGNEGPRLGNDVGQLQGICPRKDHMQGGPTVTTYKLGEITPLIGLITPVTQLFSAIYRGCNPIYH